MRKGFGKFLAFLLGVFLVAAVQAPALVAFADDGASTPAVYFQYDGGEKVPVAQGGTITLNNLDSGKFVMEGTASEAKWSAKEKIYYEDNTYETHNYINAYSGIFQPASLCGKHAVSVTDANTNRLMYSFFLENNACNVDDLKVYVDGSEVSEAAPCVASGADVKYVVAKGRITGTDKYVTIPINLLNYHTTESIYEDKIDRVDASFWVPNDATITFVVSLVDNPKMEARFLATSKHIPVTGLKVRVPETWEIHAWNGIFGDYYVGINEGSAADHYSVSIEPYNASVRKVIWEALTPDVAEFMELHGNGIVPKKNGLAKFRVHSAEDASIYQDVEVNFVYKEPLTKATVSFEEMNLTVGASKELAIDTVPQNASEKRFSWTYSEDGIVKVTDEVSNDPSSVLIEKTTAHYISAKKEGTVVVTGTPLDQTGGAEPVVFTVNVRKSGASEQPVDAEKLTKSGIEHGVAYLNSSNVAKNAYGKEWNVFVLTRAGESLSGADKAAYLASVKEKAASLSKPTDIARVVLTLGALGEDPRNVGGVNLVEKLYSNEQLGAMPSNVVVWTLIALDSHAYAIPKNAAWSRDKLIDVILGFQTVDGGFGLSNNKSDSVDMTGMALQALAPYYVQGNEKVVKAGDRAIAFLREKMTDNCGYVEGGSENSCTIAQVITALSAMGIDCAAKKNGFTWGNKSLITNICSFETKPNGFKTYAKDAETAVNEMSTQQSTYALVAYNRFLNGKPALYDLSDVEISGSDAPSDPGSQTKPQPVNPNPGSSATTITSFAKTEVKISSVKLIGSTKVKLTWGKVRNAQGYTIYRAAKKKGSYRIVGYVSASKSAFTDKRLKAGGTYYYKVRAYTVEGGKLTQTKSLKCFKVALKPAAVKFVSAVASKKGKAKLSWKKTNGASGYVIYRKSAKEKSYQPIKTITKSAKRTFTDKGLKKGAKYAYKIKAYRVIEGKKVYGSWSKAKSVSAKR